MPAQASAGRAAASQPARRRWVRRYLPAVAAVAALALVMPGRALAYDPTSWQLWGDQLLAGQLNTAGGGPAWKPLPVFADAVFAIGGQHFAVIAWLVSCRAAALACVWLAFVIGRRLAGIAGGVGMATVAAVLVWLSYGSLVATGMSEPVCVACVLAAVAAAQAAEPKRAVLWLVAASLVRPEAWLVLVVACVWWVRTSGRRLKTAAAASAAVVGVVAAWFLPDLASGNLLRSVHRAAQPTSGGPLLTKDPVASLLLEALHGIGMPVLCAAGAAAALALGRRQRIPLLLIGLGLGWIGVDAVLVALKAASGDSRYLLPGVVPLALPAGLLPAQLLRQVRAHAVPAFGAAAALTAMLLATAPWQHLQQGVSGWRWQARQTRADQALSQLLSTPTRRLLLRCKVVSTGPYEVPLVAWALDSTFARVHAGASDGTPLLLFDGSGVHPATDYHAQEATGSRRSGWKLFTDGPRGGC